MQVQAINHVTKSGAKWLLESNLNGFSLRVSEKGAIGIVDDKGRVYTLPARILAMVASKEVLGVLNTPQVRAYTASKEEREMLLYKQFCAEIRAAYPTMPETDVAFMAHGRLKARQ